MDLDAQDTYTHTLTHTHTYTHTQTHTLTQRHKEHNRQHTTHNVHKEVEPRLSNSWGVVLDRGSWFRDMSGFGGREPTTPPTFKSHTQPHKSIYAPTHTHTHTHPHTETYTTNTTD